MKIKLTYDKSSFNTELYIEISEEPDINKIIETINKLKKEII